MIKGLTVRGGSKEGKGGGWEEDLPAKLLKFLPVTVAFSIFPPTNVLLET